MRLISKLRRLKFYYGPNKIGYIGSNVKFPRDMIIAGGQNVEIHSSTSLGKGAVLFAKNAKICIGHNVIASHNLKIITGDHERRIGVFCNEITECMKNHEIGLDQDVIIEPDVWIGMNVVILKGITIGRGSTISAGAIVTKSIPPYCIAGGVPAKVIKMYWTVDQIIEHEKALYPESERYTRKQLEEISAIFAKSN